MNRRLVWLSLFAVAMAYLEAAVVVYLRRIYYPDDPLALFPLKVWAPSELLIELGREAATVVMIMGTASLAARGGIRVLAAFSFVFGLWDIFYYIWLKLLLGWPVTLMEWDILFLIPWAWLGPWPAPVIIAALLVAWGGLVLVFDPPCRFDGQAAVLAGAGTILVLLSFLQPASGILGGGPEAVTAFVPEGFWWGAFTPGALLLGAGMAATFREAATPTAGQADLPGEEESPNGGAGTIFSERTGENRTQPVKEEPLEYGVDERRDGRSFGQDDQRAEE